MAIDGPINIRSSPTPSIQHPNRKQRIERWTHKARTPLNYNVKVLRAPHILNPSLTQKRAENRLLQYDRRLNVDLSQLGEQREKLIDQENFNQKLFARKQVLLHKTDDNLAKTLNYVRKCCKLANLYDHDEISIDPMTLLEEHEPINKTARSRSVIGSAPPTKKIEVKQTNAKSINQGNSNHDPIYLTKGQRGIQSAYVSSRSRLSPDNRPLNRNVKTVHGPRSYPGSTIESTMSTSIIKPERESSKLRRSKSRVFSTKRDIEEFRRHPERFLSKTNCYLPLLQYYATRMKSDEEDQIEETRGLVEHKRIHSSSTSSSQSDSTYDENSSVNQKIHLGHDHFHSAKSDLIETESITRPDRATLLSRLRDREYAHLNTLIRNTYIDHILKPLSPTKIFESHRRR